MNICASVAALLSYAPDDGFARSLPYSRLPVDAFAAAFAARRAVHRRCRFHPTCSEYFLEAVETPRRAPRELARAQTPRALPALGRAGGGPRFRPLPIGRPTRWPVNNLVAAVYGQTSLDRHYPLYSRADRLAGLHGETSGAHAG